MTTARAWATRLGLVALCATFTLLPACRRYAQDSPESVIASAKQMVKEGHAEHLTDLIYADTKEMRQLLDKLGEVLGTLQDLGKEVQKNFPEEIDDLRKQAEEAAKKGEASNFLTRMVGQATQGGGRRRVSVGTNGVEADGMRSGFDLLIKEIFSDPYGWLEKAEGGLSVSRENMPDDMAKVLWENKPIFGIGVCLKEQDGRWYLMLPTDLIGGRLPKSADTWEILGELMEVFDNTLKDLRDDVHQKRVRRLEDLAAKAGEKAFIPAALVFLAYEKAKEAEKKEAAKKTTAAAPAPTSPAK